MIKQTLFGMAAAGALAFAGLTASADKAQAGIDFHVVVPAPYYNHGHVYKPRYRYCEPVRRRVRVKKCYRKSNGRLKCRWRKRWRTVQVCD